MNREWLINNFLLKLNETKGKLFLSFKETIPEKYQKLVSKDEIEIWQEMLKVNDYIKDIGGTKDNQLGFFEIKSKGIYKIRHNGFKEVEIEKLIKMSFENHFDSDNYTINDSNVNIISNSRLRNIDQSLNTKLITLKSNIIKKVAVIIGIIVGLVTIIYYILEIFT